MHHSNSKTSGDNGLWSTKSEVKVEKKSEATLLEFSNNQREEVPKATVEEDMAPGENESS